MLCAVLKVSLCFISFLMEEKKETRFITVWRNCLNPFHNKTVENICALDNFFTLPSVMECSRELNVGVIGTARNRPNYPPKEMKQVKETCFNALHLMNHDKKFLVARWLDNNIVNLVWTIHKGKEVKISQDSLDEGLLCCLSRSKNVGNFCHFVVIATKQIKSILTSISDE
jgi:hypothetical protein